MSPIDPFFLLLSQSVQPNRLQWLSLTSSHGSILHPGGFAIQVSFLTAHTSLREAIVFMFSIRAPNAIPTLEPFFTHWPNKITLFITSNYLKSVIQAEVKRTPEYVIPDPAWLLFPFLSERPCPWETNTQSHVILLHQIQSWSFHLSSCILSSRILEALLHLIPF